MYIHYDSTVNYYLALPLQTALILKAEIWAIFVCMYIYFDDFQKTMQGKTCTSVI